MNWQYPIGGVRQIHRLQTDGMNVHESRQFNNCPSVVSLPFTPVRRHCILFDLDGVLVDTRSMIAKALSAYSSIPMFSNVLQKIRTTRSIHTLLSTTERKSELAGSMIVPQDKFYLVETKVVLLIDDVVTYGTHFKEARNVLLEAGVQRVLASAVSAASKYTHFDIPG